MRVYRMNQPIQYYKPACRKDGEIQVVGSKVPSYVWMLLLFVSFAFSSLFVTKMTLTSYIYAYSDLIGSVDMNSVFFLTIAIVGLMDMLVLYCEIAIYNFIARWYLRGEIPCQTSELFKNLMPFFVIRNTILGVLSLLMFIPSGVFVSMGLASFEMIATMIIFIPAFNAIKKRYIKQGYSREIFQAYAVPYIILQATFLIF